MRCWMVILFLIATPAAAGDLLTHYEKSGRKATPRYTETIDYCKRLAKASRWIHYTTFGTSPQGRDLPLLIADKDRSFEPSRVRRSRKVVLLIQAGIHAGESDGKDAGFMLLRDIAVAKRYPGILDHVTIVFVPIFNVDGHEHRFGPYNRINQNGPEEMGWRVTAQKLNLNRDYLKVDTPEMEAWLGMFNAWRPDFFVDCHVTDGADYQYVITYLMETHGNMAPSITQWTKQHYLDPVKKTMNAAGYEMSPYVFLKDWPNPRSGMISWVATPRFAHGYTALRNRPGLLIETHMLKDYETRVSGTYELLRQTVELLNRDHATLRTAVQRADAFTASAAFRAEPFAVAYKASDESTVLDFKGIAYDEVASDVSGGTWLRFNGKPETFEVQFQGEQVPTERVDLPEAYIIPPEWTEVIRRLEVHGVEVVRLVEPVKIHVASYRFDQADWGRTPFEGRLTLTANVTPIEEERVFPAGSAIVDMNQPDARVAAHVLEPKAPDSYLFWGFFNTIFEQKEYASSYVMEQMAREMLDADDNLRSEFEKKKKEDTDFAKNPRAILNWFYQRTPYWDDRKDVYPVGKILSRGDLDKLLSSNRRF